MPGVVREVSDLLHSGVSPVELPEMWSMEKLQIFSRPCFSPGWNTKGVILIVMMKILKTVAGSEIPQNTFFFLA